jgi:hypothetical protein
MLKFIFGGVPLIWALFFGHPGPHVDTHASRSVHRAPIGCTASNWRSTLNGAESWIIAHEHGEHLLSNVSDYKATHDPNPNSSAFGVGQLLYSTRRQYYPDGSYLGTDNPCVQLAGMRSYIKDRYGDSWSAFDFWQAHRWY